MSGRQMRYPSELVKNLHPAKDGWKESLVEIHEENKPNAYTYCQRSVLFATLLLALIDMYI